MLPGGVYMLPQEVSLAQPEACAPTSSVWGFKWPSWTWLSWFRAWGKRKRTEEEEDKWLDTLEDEVEVSPPRAKRPRLSDRVAGTPALSPLGAPFTPVPRWRQGMGPETVRTLFPGSSSHSAELIPFSHGPADAGPADNGAKPVIHVSTSRDFWMVQVEAIYRKRNPYKLKNVPSLLKRYRGQEAVLYKKVCLTYDLDPSKFYAGLETWQEDEEEDENTSCMEAAQAAQAPPEPQAIASQGPFGGRLIPHFSRASLGEGLLNAFRRSVPNVEAAVPEQKPRARFEFEVDGSYRPAHGVFPLSVQDVPVRFAPIWQQPLEETGRGPVSGLSGLSGNAAPGLASAEPERTEALIGNSSTGRSPAHRLVSARMVQREEPEQDKPLVTSRRGLVPSHSTNLGLAKQPVGRLPPEKRVWPPVQQCSA